MDRWILSGGDEDGPDVHTTDVKKEEFERMGKEKENRNWWGGDSEISTKSSTFGGKPKDCGRPNLQNFRRVYYGFPHDSRSQVCQEIQIAKKSSAHLRECAWIAHSFVFCRTTAVDSGRHGSGPRKVDSDPCLARSSALSFPKISLCPGTQKSITLLAIERFCNEN
jgi:hypothetical protein